jgi:hypothetical protein
MLPVTFTFLSLPNALILAIRDRQVAPWLQRCVKRAPVWVGSCLLGRFLKEQ